MIHEHNWFYKVVKMPESTRIKHINMPPAVLHNHNTGINIYYWIHSLEYIWASSTQPTTRETVLHDYIHFFSTMKFETTLSLGVGITLQCADHWNWRYKVKLEQQTFAETEKAVDVLDQTRGKRRANSNT